MNAKQAIARSISHMEIVTLAYCQAVFDELNVVADGSVDTGERVEFWATNDEQWRVHLNRSRNE